MDRNQFLKTVAVLVKTYPREKFLQDEESVEIWYRFLSDIPYQLLMTAVGEWTTTQKYPPTIAELRAMCEKAVNGEEPDWGEEWNKVIKAIGKYGYMNQTGAREALSDRTWETIRYLGGWQSLCLSENTVADRANFRDCYERLKGREVHDRQLPASVRKAIAGFAPQQIGDGDAR